MKAILFDLDDTLYDQLELFKGAHEEVFGGRFAGMDIRRLFEARMRRSDEVFEPSQTGKISMEEMYIYRGQKSFEDLGEQISAEEALLFQEAYARRQKQLSVTETMRVALEHCISRRVPVGVITNGPSSHQWRKINAMDLTRWIPKEHIIVSGDCQVMKPSPEIFAYAKKRMGLEEEECWFVGDSFANDMKGAQNAGWRSIWLKKRECDLSRESFRPDYQVESEEELLELIKKLV